VTFGYLLLSASLQGTTRVMQHGLASHAANPRSLPGAIHGGFPD